MAFNTSSLTAWVDANSDVLLRDIVTPSRLIENNLASVHLGVKGSQLIPVLDMASGVTVTEGHCNSWNGNDIPVNNVTLTVTDYSAKYGMCHAAFNDTLLQKSLNAGSYENEIALAGTVVQHLAEHVAFKVEEQFFTSLFTAVQSASASTTNITLTAMTASNGYDVAKSVYEQLPSNIRGKRDAVVYLNASQFDALGQSMVNANLYHFDPQADTPDTITLPLTGLRFARFESISDSDNRMIVARVPNIHYGTDVLGEGAGSAQYWWSQDAQEHRFLANYKIGATVSTPSEIAYVA